LINFVFLIYYIVYNVLSSINSHTDQIYTHLDVETQKVEV